MVRWGKLDAKSTDFVFNSNYPINIAEGAIRSGKTVAAIIRWLRFLAQTPIGEPMVMVGKTQQTLLRNMLTPLIDLLKQNIVINWKIGACTIFGHIVYLVGASDERAENKIRGATFGGALCDEITLYPENFFKMLLSRLSGNNAKFFGTTNPDSPYHWLKREYIDNADMVKNEDIRTWKFTLLDNTYLPKKYVDRLQRQYSGLFYRRFILGEWCLAEGIIYDMFDVNIHVIDASQKRYNTVWASVDYGTSNPCTFGLYGQDGKVSVLLKEYWWDSKKNMRQKTDAEYREDFVKFCGNYTPEFVFIDPSAASFIAELHTKTNYCLKKANNDVLDGIIHVSKMLASKEFFIDKTCVETIREYQTYSWDPAAVIQGKDLPLKKGDHAVDRDRYALYSRSKNRAIIV